MPPVKEFHYFNRVCINKQLLGEWSTPYRLGIKRYTEATKQMDYRKLRWLYRYYELGMGKDCYLGLFDEKYIRGSVSGEITPAYSTLDEAGVKYASQVLDKNIPVLLIIRNPIHRTWSAVKMLLRYENLSADTVTHDKITSLLEMPHIRLGSEYSKIILLWKKYFNNVHVLSFDELCDNSRALLSKISRIDDTWDEDVIRKRVWADEKKIPIPEEVLDILVKYYAEEINTLRTIDGCECAED